MTKIHYFKRRGLGLMICLSFFGCAPLQEFNSFPEYPGNNDFKYITPVSDQVKTKTVFIVADTKGTENFDLMAPFYLFNLTGKCNVYLVAERKYPIIIRKGFFTLPHYTFSEVDSLGIIPDVVVIPALSSMNKKGQDPVVLQWLRAKQGGNTKTLSICAGALTAAASGMYDGLPLTTHTLEIGGYQKMAPLPKWQNNIAYTKSGNLYSTAGISNAVDGTILVIEDLFGVSVARSVMAAIHFPKTDISVNHVSQTLTGARKGTILHKILKRGRKIGVLLQEGMDEFAFSAVLDTYHRTFPGSIKTFSMDVLPITSRFGLTLIPTDVKEEIPNLDELHILHPDLVSKRDDYLLGRTKVINYDPTSKDYIFETCLKRIKEQYGDKFEGIVRILLDYN